MSTVKSPEAKKFLSLKHDRRNTYGENAKASRKGIPRSKQLSSKGVRAAIAEVLMNQKGPSEKLDLDNAEAVIKARTIESKRKRFRKRPDAPLLSVLLAKKDDTSVWRGWHQPPLIGLSPDSIDRLREDLKD